MAQFYVNRGEAFGLRDLDQELARELEQREKRHHEDRHAPLRLEQLRELENPALLQRAQDRAHVLAHRKLLARNAVVLRHARTVQQAAPGLGEILRALKERRVVEFAELFEPQRGVAVLVVTFLALLELARELLIEITQSAGFGPIYVKLAHAQSA